MFKSKEQSVENQIISTVIDQGFLIEGNISGNAVIRIDGEIKGNISSDIGVILGEKSLITGNIHSKFVIVYGHVNGNIKTDRLELKNTGVIQGDIEAIDLEVELGGIYNGTLSMKNQSVPSEKIL